MVGIQAASTCRILVPAGLNRGGSEDKKGDGGSFRPFYRTCDTLTVEEQEQPVFGDRGSCLLFSEADICRKNDALCSSGCIAAEYLLWCGFCGFWLTEPESFLPQNMLN